MKKVNVVLLIGIVVYCSVVFTACTPSFKEPSVYEDLPEYYNPSTDYPMAFYEVAARSIAQTEKGYYFFQNMILYYFDKETSNVIAVCNRPECSHQNDSCSAYFPTDSRWLFIQYYENSLYVEATETDGNGYTLHVLYRVNPKECTREKICQLPYDWTVHHSYMMHRGYLYMTAVDSVDCIYTFSRVALNELAEKSLTPEVIYQEDQILLIILDVIYIYLFI